MKYVFENDVMFRLYCNGIQRDSSIDVMRSKIAVDILLMMKYVNENHYEPEDNIKKVSYKITEGLETSLSRCEKIECTLTVDDIKFMVDMLYYYNNIIWSTEYIYNMTYAHICYITGCDDAHGYIPNDVLVKIHNDIAQWFMVAQEKIQKEKERKELEEKLEEQRKEAEETKERAIRQECVKKFVQDANAKILNA